jgi:maltose alpha-D-glucosyltransferase/alpha-amylase
VSMTTGPVPIIRGGLAGALAASAGSMATGAVPAIGGAVGGAASWYKDAIIYELHVRAFQDSNADGIGDFRGLVTRLDHLQDLGVTAIWLLPFYPSPLRDDGYDISDYRKVHPNYGTLRDFRTFLDEAHRRGLRVITELVLAHTSEAHPWFQRARRARPGSLTRDYYVWSDTPDRYSDARIIFKDFESSNWTFDPVAGAYYWHRFYSHQPSLNYDNLDVEAAMVDVLDYWLEMGVDGLRLDAVPYLYAREGTTCENLPETIEFLRRLRAHVDERFSNRMLLAEANQWPEDAVAYLGAGKGELCHMAFHFPLMPRMFMAARQEDRYPIVDVMSETPEIPPSCQWGLFLRNHDELTLEMVTDEERDYMYRAYARDPRARVNVGIRRRLAPLLGNDRRLIEMMNGLLFSLPGTPILYYGDEIGMGDNIYLGDRNSVRTPMQWASDRNAGFSRANPQQLYLPVVIDPEYQPQAVNVESQQANSSSLLWWMKRLVSLRKRHQAFGRGSLEFLNADNRKVLTFLRSTEQEQILVVANLSRFTQGVELDLSKWRGAVPVELFGGSELPAIGDLPYFFTLGPHDFYWLQLDRPGDRGGEAPVIDIRGSWETVFVGSALRRLQEHLPSYIAARRWFPGKTRRIKGAEVAEVIPIPSPTHRDTLACCLVLVRTELDHGAPEIYQLPVACASAEAAEDVRRFHPEAVVASLRSPVDDSLVLYDASWSNTAMGAVLDLLTHRRRLPARSGRVVGVPAAGARLIPRLAEGEGLEAVPLRGEQSNTSVVFSRRVILKLLRRLEPGVNPGVELGRYLSEQARFANVPGVVGSIEYRSEVTSDAPFTIASAEVFVENEGDGWSYVIDGLRHALEEALAGQDLAESLRRPAPSLLEVAFGSAPGSEAEHQQLLVPHLEWAALLGRRTAELHLALHRGSDPDLRPEPLTAVDRQALSHAARTEVRRTLRALRPLSQRVPELQLVIAAEGTIIERLRRLERERVEVAKIRCHGDYHLGQVLWTGRDFLVIDFEGEPGRALGQRRLKRPAMLDVAGMLRSLHYAARTAAATLALDLAGSSTPSVLSPLLRGWYASVGGSFLRAYLDTAGTASFIPRSRRDLELLLDFFLFNKAIYELGYEANSRPDWVGLPALGILELLETSAPVEL